jgi:hypothetical protein
MERARISKDEIIEQNKHFLAVCLETVNSCFILLSEKEDKLGTLAIAVPKPKDMLGSPTSSVLLGDRNAILARMFAEYVTVRKEKLALVSIYLVSTNEEEAQPIFKKLVERIIRMELNTEKEEVQV